MLTRSVRMVNMVLRQPQKDVVDDSDEEVVEQSESEYQPTECSSNRNSTDTSNYSRRSSEIPIIPQVYYQDNEGSSSSTHNYAISKFQHQSNRKRIRRKHTCLFCDQNVGNFARHLERQHGDELAVQEFLSMDKKSLNRKKMIDKLRREGDFCTSSVVPVMNANKERTEYIPCKFCRGYYAPQSLRRHAKKCYFNPDPSKRFNAQVEGQTLMSGHFGPTDILRVSGLLNMMRADNVSLAAKTDPIICEVGRRYIRSHKEKHLLLVAKRNMRRLARLLLSVRRITQNNSLKLIDILTPVKFKVLIKATHDIAEYDEKERTFKSPSLALQMGTLIKSAINTAYSLEIQKTADSHSKNLENFKALTSLIETDWAYEISTEAGQNLQVNRFNKPTFIPLAEDVAKFEEYLKKIILKTKTKLVDDSSDLKSFRELQEAIFCSILIFNKRRVGELQRMPLSAYTKNINTLPPSSEFEKALTEAEKILLKSLKRIVIRGKRGRGVPVLLEPKIVESIDFAILLRTNFDLHNNTYLFGIPGTENPITGNAVMRKHAKLALGDVNKATLLTSTRLRKQLATVIQILNMNKGELEQLATFMGHTEKTHSEFYRLPDDVYQTAKVSKLLLLAKNTSIDKFKGQSLANININADIPEENDNSDNDYVEMEEESATTVPPIDVINEENSNGQPIRTKKGPKRTLVAWTTEQKNLTEEYFRKHINRNKAPKKDEVMSLVAKHPDVFHNKSWQVIKVYVQNKCKKK